MAIPMKTEAKSKRLAGDCWCRGDYVLDGNGALFLKRGGEVEPYDPWGADATARMHSEEERPYKQLLRLTQQIDLRGEGLPTRKRQRLEAWVRKNGLLGVLPQQTLSFTTAPRWVNRDEYLAEVHPGEPVARKHLWAIQRSVYRVAGAWRERSEGPLGSRVYNRAFLDQPAEAADLSPNFRPAEALLQSLGDGQVMHIKLTDAAWWRFFHLGATGLADYPVPDTDRFWRTYGETLADFLGAARQLSGALGDIKRAANADDQALLGHGYARLVSLAGPASLAAFASDAGPNLGFSAPSLLACFAVLALQDLVGGQEIRQCDNCGALFPTKAREAKFCSTTCRTTSYKRGWRAKNRS